MLRHIYNNVFNNEQKLKIKFKYYGVKKSISDTFFRYNFEELKSTLQHIGIHEGDTVLVHSSYNIFSGFQGKPQDIIRCFFEIVGSHGNILMVSIPYMSSTYEYLRSNPIFDVRKTMSKMGIISEIFRRRKDVVRSLHPTHPILARGPYATWIVEGHENCQFPCGKYTPFEKFLTLNGKVLLFDTTFNTSTFIHYIEDLIKDRLPFPLYAKEPVAARIINHQGVEMSIMTYVFSNIAVMLRDPYILQEQLLKRRMLKKARIGLSTFMVFNVEDAIRCTYEMADKGLYFYRDSNILSRKGFN